MARVSLVRSPLVILTRDACFSAQEMRGLLTNLTAHLTITRSRYISLTHLILNPVAWQMGLILFLYRMDEALGS